LLRKLYLAQVVYKPSASLAQGVLNFRVCSRLSFPASSVHRWAPPRRRGLGLRPTTSFEYNLRRDTPTNVQPGCDSHLDYFMEVFCYRVGGEYEAARLTPHRGLIAGDIEAQQWMSQSRRRSREAFSPRRPKISSLWVNYYSLMITMDSIGYLYITGASL
jgi:hypothetical protein